MSTVPKSDPRRHLPAVDRLLAEPRLAELEAVYGRERLLVQARTELDRLRDRADEVSAEELERSVSALPELIAAALESALGVAARRVLNATGIFLHTNLGRAPLPREVAARLPSLLDAACDVELDLDSGKRGDRLGRIVPVLRALTGAESALAVNNNAAALTLALATLAHGRDVVVSRGELVEIGDSFRIPDLAAAAGVRLVEVGTTNRTHPDDYRRALAAGAALVLKVVPGNYRVRGFVAEVAVEELIAIARTAGVPLLVDEGSGLLRRHPAPQLADHRSFAELIAAGADLVAGSGDKLLGGPQAGILAGRSALIEPCRRHPLYRALRLGRAPALALDELLRMHLAGAELPLDRLWVDSGRHRRRLEAVRAALAPLELSIVAAEAFVGGGSAPDAAIPGEALALRDDGAVARRLRLGAPPVVGYLHAGRLLLDLRTVDPGDDADLVAAVRAALD